MATVLMEDCMSLKGIEQQGFTSEPPTANISSFGLYKKTNSINPCNLHFSKPPPMGEKNIQQQLSWKRHI